MNTISNCNFDVSPVDHNEHSAESVVAIAKAVSDLAGVLNNLTKSFSPPKVESIIKIEASDER